MIYESPAIRKHVNKTKNNHRVGKKPLTCPKSKIIKGRFISLPHVGTRCFQHDHDLVGGCKVTFVEKGIFILREVLIANIEGYRKK